MKEKKKKHKKGHCEQTPDRRALFVTPPDPQKQSERREETGKCDSVRISARGCRSPLLCPDLLRQKSGSHQQSGWSSGDGPAVDGFCPVILQICAQLCSGLLRDISGGSGNNASLGHTCRWSSFMGLRWVKLNEPSSRSDFGWNKRDSTHLFFFHRSQCHAWDKDIFTGLKRFITAIYV